MRMRISLAVAAMLAVATSAQAGTIFHAPFSPFDVDVTVGGSYGLVMNFNGSDVVLGGMGVGAGTAVGTLQATYRADPGFVFTAALPTLRGLTAFCPDADACQALTLWSLGPSVYSGPGLQQIPFNGFSGFRREVASGTTGSDDLRFQTGGLTTDIRDLLNPVCPPGVNCRPGPLFLQSPTFTVDLSQTLTSNRFLFDSFGVGTSLAPLILPVAQQGDSFVFDVGVGPGISYFDSLAAIGYDFATGAGDPNFGSVTLPIIGDGIYDVVVGGVHNTVLAGQSFLFGGAGVSSFRVLGIETAAGNDPQAFVTALSFVGAGQFTGTMTPITLDTGGGANVPEPSALVLMSLGLAAAGALSRHRVRRGPRLR